MPSPTERSDGGGGGVLIGAPVWEPEERTPVSCRRLGRHCTGLSRQRRQKALQVEGSALQAQLWYRERCSENLWIRQELLSAPEFSAWCQSGNKHDMFPFSKTSCYHERKLTRLEKYGLWANKCFPQIDRIGAHRGKEADKKHVSSSFQIGGNVK